MIGDTLPSFQDVHARVSWRPRPRQRVSLVGFAGRERTRLDDDNTASDAGHETRTQNDLLALTFESSVGASGSSRTIASFSQLADTLARVRAVLRQQPRRQHAGEHRHRRSAGVSALPRHRDPRPGAETGVRVQALTAALARPGIRDAQARHALGVDDRRGSRSTRGQRVEHPARDAACPTPSIRRETRTGSEPGCRIGGMSRHAWCCSQDSE